MPIISIRDLVVEYEGRRVLDGLNLDIEPGEAMVLLGGSGSGKSTLVRCINRLEAVQSGELIVNGLHVEDPKIDIRALRQEIGMVFQQFNLYPNMTALQNITLAPIVVKQDEHDVPLSCDL